MESNHTIIIQNKAGQAIFISEKVHIRVKKKKKRKKMPESVTLCDVKCSTKNTGQQNRYPNNSATKYIKKK